MEILVCIKRYVLAGSTFVLNDDSTEIDAKNLGYTLAPHEEVAVEQAIRFVEEFGGSTTVLSLSQSDVEEQLREQLAIGADRGIILATDGSEWDPQATAGLGEVLPADNLRPVEPADDRTQHKQLEEPVQHAGNSTAVWADPFPGVRMRDTIATCGTTPRRSRSVMTVAPSACCSLRVRVRD